MSTYQPGIPTGTVNLDVDYQNIQNNFQQLDTTFGVDHVTYSNQTAQNGYHTSIHFNPVSTTTTNPPNNQPPVVPAAVPGYGQLFSAQINDGVNIDEALFFLTGGNRLQQLTRNFAPVAAQNGYTFLPGGFILQWGLKSGGAESAGNVNFPIPFPNAAYVMQGTGMWTGASDPNGAFTVGLKFNQTVGPFTSFRWVTFTNSGAYAGFWWIALGR